MHEMPCMEYVGPIYVQCWPLQAAAMFASAAKGMSKLN
jgi:hypothetical protein